jgi:type IV secretory pathway VirB9-like protein
MTAMRLRCIAASGAALGVALVMVPLLTGATGLPMDSTGAVVLRGTEGVVRRLPYMQDQIYDLTVADRTLLAINFPDGEHIKAIAQSTAPVFHVQQRGDTLQVAAERPGEKMGLNVITTRGMYHLEITSVSDPLSAASIVHFVAP